MTAAQVRPELEREQFISGVVILAVAFACGLMAAIWLALFALPRHPVLNLARRVTQEEYSILRLRFLWGGLFYGALCAILLLCRRTLIQPVAHALSSLRIASAQIRSGLANAFRTESLWHWLALAAITISGIVLRALYLQEPQRYDESFTYLVFARRSLVHVFAYYPVPNNHILHTALVWLSCRIFGDSLWAMRLPAFLSGIALIPLMYIVARRLAGRAAALLAADFMAVSGAFIVFSVNARGYSLQAALLLVMLYAAAEIVGESRRTNQLAQVSSDALVGWWVVFSLAIIAGFWTAPTMLYGYLTAAGWLLWAGRWKLLRPLIVSGAMSAITIVALYVPAAIMSGPDALLRNPWVRSLPIQEFRAEALRFPAGLMRFVHGSDPLPFAILVSLGVVVSLVFAARRGRFWPDPLLVLLLVLLVVPAVQRIVPFPRVILPLFTVYYLSAAMGWSYLLDDFGRLRFGLRLGFERPEMPALLALVALIGVLAWHVTRSGYVESWRGFTDSPAIAAYLAKHLRPCDRLIVTESAGPPLLWQLNHDKIYFHEYSGAEPPVARVLVATANLGRPVPLGNGVLNPSLYTVEGTLKYVEFHSSAYTSPRLIYNDGRGEIFELLPRQFAGRAAQACGTP